MGRAKRGRYFLGRKKQNGPVEIFWEKEAEWDARIFYRKRSRSNVIKNKTSMPKKSVHTFGSTKLCYKICYILKYKYRLPQADRLKIIRNAIRVT